MSKPASWQQCKKWTASDSPDEDELKEALQELVDRKRSAYDFLMTLQEYLEYLRYRETSEIMRNPTKRQELSFTDAIDRLQGDIEKLIKGELIHGRTGIARAARS